MSNLHILFSGQEHEEIRFDYYAKTIERLIECWDQGMHYKEICRKFNLKQVEYALIAMDLQCSGKLKWREGAFWGTEK